MLEDALGLIPGEIEARVLEDAQRREIEERAKVERAARWGEAMEDAKERAIQDQLASALRDEARRWREAAALSEYCDALEGSLTDPRG
ncbi:hypothetical protein [Streptomyces sp. NPDC000878]